MLRIFVDRAINNLVTFNPEGAKANQLPFALQQLIAHLVRHATQRYICQFIFLLSCVTDVHCVLRLFNSQIDIEHMRANDADDDGIIIPQKKKLVIF
jgi:hypothetical protein